MLSAGLDAFPSELHHEGVGAHVDVVLVFVGVVGVVDDAGDGCVRLPLADPGVEAQDAARLVGVPEAVVDNAVGDAYLRGVLGEGLAGGVVDDLFADAELSCQGVERAGDVA